MEERIESLRARESILLPVTLIRRERMPWQVRIVVSDEEVARLASGIKSTQEIVPIRVVHRDGGYDLVTGMLRLLAAEHLAYESVPAFVEENADPEMLLRLALLEQDLHFPLRYLERGWALARLTELRKARGLPHRQADLVKATGLDKGTVSAALKAASIITEARAEELAQEHGIGVEDVAGLGRAQVRRIVGAADEEERGRLTRVICAALAEGRSPAQAIADAQQAVEAGKTAAGVREGIKWIREAARRIVARIGRAIVRLRAAFRRRLGRGGNGSADGG